ncbi:jerky protein homolog-like [Sipha flava]|uniref:Jerky protein homolog-like n=1 Tax=Sipha flava TaxID=143950 RepID=A0A8B8FR71_9HEMI|nr:jerky protein homolog-like [Sipha flava]
MLNIETKIEIIEKLEKGESGSSLAQFYNVNKSTIGDIKRKKENILSNASNMDSTDGKKTRKKKFKEIFLNMIKREGYTKNDVYNADETGINWKASRQESSTPSYKVSKDRITAMVCANASGDHALPLLVIGTAIKPRCFKNVNQLPVKYKAQKSAWMNSKLFYEWYCNEFIPKVKQEQEYKGRKGKVLLLLDNAPSHPSAEKLNIVDPNFKLENNANDLGFEILNDDEIVEAVKESELPSEIENEYEDVKNYTGLTLIEAFTAMESAMH